MEIHPIESLMQTAMNSIKDMIDVDTIIGETIETKEGTTIIPISKVCFGFAAGGSDFKKEVVEEYKKEDKTETIKTRNPFGGGAGAGVKITPIGFLIVENKESPFPRFITVEQSCAIDKLLDYIPDLFKKVENVMCKKKEKSSDKKACPQEEVNSDEGENVEDEISEEIENDDL